MTTNAGSLRFGISLASLVFVAACGGTSVSHGGDDDAAGMSGVSGKGVSGGTGGTASGKGGDAGNTTGGTGGTARGGSGGDAGNTTGGTSAGGTGGDAGGSTSVGGTTSVGGSSSGAAGSSGTTSCTPGERCSVDGATCNVGTCCPCQSTCKNGVWQNLLCPPCVAPGCPAQPPTDGDSCNACQVPSEGCSWDTCAVDGPRYKGFCNGVQWDITSSSCTPGGCCSADSDCGVGGRCLAGGSCVPPAGTGLCWVDGDCDAGELCSGVFACGCGVNCSTANTSGTCVPRNMNCCANDSDCPAESECVKGDCKQKSPTNTTCWSDHDCSAGGQCFGATVCACGTDCLVADSPGMCVFPL